MSVVCGHPSIERKHRIRSISQNNKNIEQTNTNHIMVSDVIRTVAEILLVITRVCVDRKVETWLLIQTNVVPPSLAVDVKVLL